MRALEGLAFIAILLSGLGMIILSFPAGKEVWRLYRLRKERNRLQHQRHIEQLEDAYQQEIDNRISEIDRELAKGTNKRERY